MPKLYRFQQNQNLNLIEECHDNREKQGRYFWNCYGPLVVTVIAMILALILDAFIILGKLIWAFIVILIFFIFIFVVTRFFKNRYDYFKEVKRKPEKDRRRQMEEIAKSFHLNRVSDESINDKIEELNALFKLSVQYRNKVWHYFKLVAVPLVGAAFTVFLKSSGDNNYQIYHFIFNGILILIIIIAVLTVLMCMNSGYQLYNLTINSFLVPNANLISYSVFYLEVLRCEMNEEINRPNSQSCAGITKQLKNITKQLDDFEKRLSNLEQP